MPSGYEQLEPGEPWEISTKEKKVKHACCDCGLIHDVIIEKKSKDEIVLKFYVNKRATSQYRKRNKMSLKITQNKKKIK